MGRIRIRLFGGNNIFSLIYEILHMIRENEKILEGTPKTLSVREGLYLDRIGKDFPELNLDLAKSYVGELIADYLKCLETGDTSELQKDATENLVMQALGRKSGECSRQLKMHRVVVSDYRVLRDHAGNPNEARITFQAACQYIREAAGRKKRRDKMIQTRYEIQYSYFLKETEGGVSEVLRCSYCGAPVERLGDKVCRYCGNGVADTLKRSWKFSDIREF